jgi:type II secretion system protein G
VPQIGTGGPLGDGKRHQEPLAEASSVAQALRKAYPKEDGLIRKQKGFTLIELLIVVAVIGIIAAIAIPDFLNALNRGRQKRTMADIRSIGTALDAYSVDFNFYPRTAITAGTVTALAPYLTPTFIKVLPALDGWGEATMVELNPTGTAYTIWSKAKGGAGTLAAATQGGTTDFRAAIVFAHGQFYSWPEGMQTN